MKYWLKDSNGCAVLEIDIEMLTKYLCDFTIYKPISWEMDNTINTKKFIADVHWKWDMCTHWWFYGEEYNKSCNNFEKDSYYHICSDHSDYIRMFAFARKVMYLLLGDEQGWYNEKDKELDEVVLNGYEIMEVK